MKTKNSTTLYSVKKRWYFQLFLGVFGLISVADDSAELKVKWYQPEIKLIETKTVAKVLISGKTRPGSKVSVDLKKVLRVQPGASLKPVYKITNTKRKVLTQADENGNFALNISLPFAAVVVPVMIESQSQTKNYALRFKVEKEQILLDDVEDSLEKSPMID